MTRFPRLLAFLSPLVVAAGLWAVHPSHQAEAQGNPTCPTRPITDNSNACADTAFVQNISGAIIAGGTTLSPIDIYLIIGASNSVGQGISAQAPTPPATALMYCLTTGVQPLADPACSAVNAAQNANTGSMWPAFAIAYNRPVGLVLTGVSGSTQATACDFLTGNGNWQSTAGGSNYANALAAINAALPAYAAAGYAPTFRGIISNDLGGNDGVQINNIICTSTQYTAGYTTMAANWRAATIGGKTYPHLPIYESIIGVNSSTTDSPGLVQIRNAQLSIAAADGNTLLPFVELPSFGVRGWMQPASGHPTQIGYNEWGSRLGGAILPYIAGNLSYQVYNANSAAMPLPIAGTVLQLAGPDSIVPSILFDGFGTNAAPTSILRSAGGTNASPTALGNSANIGIFAVRGYGATGYSTKNNAALLFSTTQPWTDTAQGNQGCIFTTANGTTTPACNLTVGQDGVVTLSTLSASNISGGSLSFLTAGVARETILNNGNIGIGTETNPQNPLVVSQNSATGFNLTNFNGITLVGATNAIAGYNAVGINTFANYHIVRINGTVGSPTNLANSDPIAGLNFGGWGNGAIQTARAQIVATATEAWSGATFGTSLQFSATPAGGARTQAMLLQAGATFGTGTGDPGVGNIALSGTVIAPSMALDTGLADRSVCWRTLDGKFFTGSGAAGICLGTSSVRFKHDIAPLQVGLAQILALEPISYRLNADHGDPNKLLYGFTAEQGQTVLPNLVGHDAEGRPQTFDYLGVVPVLVRAIQQLKADNDNLHVEVEKLKARKR